MKNFFKWNLPLEKPFLILGKGPTIENINNYDLSKFTLVGLNEASLYHKCYFTHFIDWDVFSNNLFRSALYFVCPWFTHIHFKPDGIGLQDRLNLSDYQVPDNTFWWYNCSTWKKKPKDQSEIVQARFFSSEAVFRLLGMKGIKQINTAGIDGGTEYHSFFKQKKLTPLGNGRASFDEQFGELDKICQQYQLTWTRL